MSQYGANYYQEQQSQNTYSPRSNQTQTHYPMVETVYDQKYEPASGRPLGHDAPQSQYTTEGANASYYSGESAADPNDPDGEKGLGSTVVGGVAGGYMGDKMGGGWSTAAGAGFGTIGMNLLSHKMKPQSVPVQQVLAPPQQVEYFASSGINGSMGLLGRRQALLSDRLARRGGTPEGTPWVVIRVMLLS